MRFPALAILAGFCLEGQTPDHYPQVRALVLEAASSTANIRLLNDRSNPHTWAGDILAHAGYLEDAERIYARSPGPFSDPPVILWRSWVVYGQRKRAEQFIESLTDPEKKASYSAMLADLVWRTGRQEQARLLFESARVVAMKIVNPGRREKTLAAIDRDLKFASEPPPNLVSATPNPPPRLNVADSPIPAFPISVDGFEDLSPEAKALRARADGDMLKRLYDRAAAGDRENLTRITQSAATPFQKALAIASLQHVLIQQNQPELAEKYAKMIPETNSPATLAKAEALGASATAWLRVRDVERARAAFDLAKSKVLSLRDLPFGRISVLASIAAAECKGRLFVDGNATFRNAIQQAQKLPLRPQPIPGVQRRPTPLGLHFNDEAFGKILRAAIQSKNAPIANETVEIWTKSGGKVGSEVVNAWLEAGQTAEAIAAARSIKESDSRISALLSLAQHLLNDAGAPIF